MAGETSPPAPPASPEPAGELEQASPPPEVAPALALFDRGDHRAAAALLARLLAERPAPAIEQAARALQRRLAPDRAALVVGLGTLALLLLITALYVL
jgi:hypothetical protein